METARELLDDALVKGPAGHYQSFTAEIAGKPVGWVCFGPTPCTVGTFDIYWIAVAKGIHRRGLGTALTRHAEDRVRESGGRIVVIETSGRASYRPTQRFYEKLGYRRKGRIPDFYAPGDDKIIYVKDLDGRPAARHKG